MAQLARDVRRTDEFKAVFERAGGLPPSARVQCAEVQHTTSRAWWRLVGRRHDVQWWLPDVSNASALPVPQHPMGNFAYSPANMCVFIPPRFRLLSFFLLSTFDFFSRLTFDDRLSIHPPCLF